ncbi:MAG: ShlB/FhaC/HecB family hemolysin secretion/activation protein [Veillonellaceae bacterium]|nr:ShlB/FhaC/HecB family hemolysin secretion/activation protein [Veillonellaceae bacterium]
MRSSLRYRALAAAVLLGMAASGTASAAPSLWEPGQDIGAQAPKPSAAVESPLFEAPKTEEASFTVKSIDIDASELKVDKAQLATLMQDCIGDGVTLSKLNEAIAQVTAYCRTHGYPASAAYLPAQEAEDGAVKIRVIPGRYGDVKLENHSKLKDSVAMRFVGGLKKGEIIRSKGLETTLYSISDVSGTKAVGVLAPGKEFGTSDVTVRIEDGKLSNTVLYVENYGSKSSGRYRYGLQQSFYDIAGTGSRASLGGLISNARMHNYYATYEMPVGRGGHTLGLGISQMDYKLGGPFRAWGANGKAKTVSLFGSVPIYHMHDGQLKVLYGYDYRKLEDDLDIFGGLADSDKHSSSAHVGIAGNQQLDPKTSVDFDATVTHGTLTMDSTYAQLRDALGGDTEGSFTKFTFDGTLVRSLGHRTDVMEKISGQAASRNLDGSEQLYLGGANAIRAYPQGEGSGDDGITSTTEFRYYTDVPGLILSTYFDIGHSKFAHDGKVGSETLKGWGLAASYQRPGDWFARLDYARRIGDSKYLSEDAKAKGRLWFLLGKIW